MDGSLATLLHEPGRHRDRGHAGLPELLQASPWLEVAPILPYLLMVLILIFRPKGLLGTGRTDE